MAIDASSRRRLLGTMAVALDTEEGRAFLQQRLSAFGRAAFIISSFFFIVGTTAATFLVPQFSLLEGLLQPITLWHLAGIAASAALWLLLRKGKPSAGWISVIDVVANVGTCAAYSMMAFETVKQGNSRPDLLAMLILMSTLTLRAVLVPSTWRQTLLVTVAAIQPALVMAFVVGREQQDVMQSAFVLLPVSVGSWGAATAMGAAISSRVIYGLRRQAVRAQRLGQYELLNQIGQGGMGVVYRARHALLRRPTAIKLLSPEVGGAAALSRFEREVQLTARLTHPNTVSIFDYGRTPDGVFYYAMELLDGVDLEQLVELHGPQDPRRVVHVLKQICGSLAEAHGIGLVHRDIKPANVILCERGGVQDVAKVVDFGLVKEVRTEGEDPKLSAVDSIVGTPMYMAPEAIRSAAGATAASDLYAVGAVAYYLLTATTVFPGPGVVEVCASHLHEAPTPPSERLGQPIDAELERIVMACLEKEPGDRPASAADLHAQLDALTLGPWRAEDARRWWADHPSQARVPTESVSPTALTVAFSDRATSDDAS